MEPANGEATTSYHVEPREDMARSTAATASSSHNSTAGNRAMTPSRSGRTRRASYSLVLLPLHTRDGTSAVTPTPTLSPSRTSHTPSLRGEREDPVEVSAYDAKALAARLAQELQLVRAQLEAEMAHHTRLEKQTAETTNQQQGRSSREPEVVPETFFMTPPSKHEEGQHTSRYSTDRCTPYSSSGGQQRSGSSMLEATPPHLMLRDATSPSRMAMNGVHHGDGGDPMPITGSTPASLSAAIVAAKDFPTAPPLAFLSLDKSSDISTGGGVRETTASREPPASLTPSPAQGGVAAVLRAADVDPRRAYDFSRPNQRPWRYEGPSEATESDAFEEEEKGGSGTSDSSSSSSVLSLSAGRPKASAEEPEHTQTLTHRHNGGRGEGGAVERIVTPEEAAAPPVSIPTFRVVPSEGSATSPPIRTRPRRPSVSFSDSALNGTRGGTNGQKTQGAAIDDETVPEDGPFLAVPKPPARDANAATPATLQESGLLSMTCAAERDQDADNGKNEKRVSDVAATSSGGPPAPPLLDAHQLTTCAAASEEGHHSLSTSARVMTPTSILIKDSQRTSPCASPQPSAFPKSALAEGKPASPSLRRVVVEDPYEFEELSADVSAIPAEEAGEGYGSVLCLTPEEPPSVHQDTTMPYFPEGMRLTANGDAVKAASTVEDFHPGSDTANGQDVYQSSSVPSTAASSPRPGAATPFTLRALQDARPHVFHEGSGGRPVTAKVDPFTSRDSASATAFPSKASSTVPTSSSSSSPSLAASSLPRQESLAQGSVLLAHSNEGHRSMDHVAADTQEDSVNRNTPQHRPVEQATPQHSSSERQGRKGSQPRFEDAYAAARRTQHKRRQVTATALEDTTMETEEDSSSGDANRTAVDTSDPYGAVSEKRHEGARASLTAADASRQVGQMQDAGKADDSVDHFFLTLGDYLNRREGNHLLSPTVASAEPHVCPRCGGDTHAMRTGATARKESTMTAKVDRAVGSDSPLDAAALQADARVPLTKDLLLPPAAAPGAPVATAEPARDVTVRLDQLCPGPPMTLDEWTRREAVVAEGEARGDADVVDWNSLREIKRLYKALCIHKGGGGGLVRSSAVPSSGAASSLRASVCSCGASSGATGDITQNGQPGSAMAALRANLSPETLALLTKIGALTQDQALPIQERAAPSPQLADRCQGQTSQSSPAEAAPVDGVTGEGVGELPSPELSAIHLDSMDGLRSPTSAPNTARPSLEPTRPPTLTVVAPKEPSAKETRDGGGCHAPTVSPVSAGTTGGSQVSSDFTAALPPCASNARKGTLASKKEPLQHPSSSSPARKSVASSTPTKTAAPAPAAAAAREGGRQCEACQQRRRATLPPSRAASPNTCRRSSSPRRHPAASAKDADDAPLGVDARVASGTRLSSDVAVAPRAPQKPRDAHVLGPRRGGRRHGEPRSPQHRKKTSSDTSTLSRLSPPPPPPQQLQHEGHREPNATPHDTADHHRQHASPPSSSAQDHQLIPAPPRGQERVLQMRTVYSSFVPSPKKSETREGPGTKETTGSMSVKQSTNAQAPRDFPVFPVTVARTSGASSSGGGEGSEGLRYAGAGAALARPPPRLGGNVLRALSTTPPYTASNDHPSSIALGLRAWRQAYGERTSPGEEDTRGSEALFYVGFCSQPGLPGLAGRSLPRRASAPPPSRLPEDFHLLRLREQARRLRPASSLGPGVAQ